MKVFAQTMREHSGAIALACVAALIVLAPNIMLWKDPGFRGIEMMMLDAENHYLARITEVSQGHLTAANTFLPDKNIPYATPPLGEIIIAFFGKLIHVSAARGAILSKPISLFIITILIYALAFVMSRSRIASLLAAAVPVFGYNLIALSPAPFLDLVRGSPSGGPFLFFSRLVNPSISGIVLFGALYLIYREFFEREQSRWWRVAGVGVLTGVSAYITPFTYTFLGGAIIAACVWLCIRRDYFAALRAFSAGAVGILLAVPFYLNYRALAALPGYPHLAQFLGLVDRREFIIGALLPLMAAVVLFLWPRKFNKEGKPFFLACCAALLCVLNEQLLTGAYLQPGHYHWYITKPLAGVIAGLFAGYLIERFFAPRWRGAAAIVVLAVLAYNSMGFLAPWYASTRANALNQQRYGPLVQYLNTIPQPQVVWADEDASDFIPIYTIDDAPNSINVGSYPEPESFFENRLFLEYRLRGISPNDFESTIHAEAHHVGDRLWGVWLQQQFGDPSAIPADEFPKLTAGYRAFSKLTWQEAFDSLGITYVVAQGSGEVKQYAPLATLKERARVGDFVLYGRR